MMEFKLHRQMKCHVTSLQYDFAARTGTVNAIGPTDMSGAIRIFEAIDPGVVEIKTYLDGRPDVLYWHGHDDWHAVSADEDREIVVVNRGAA